MIKSFKSKGLKKFFNEGNISGIQFKHADKVSLILDLLDAAAIIGDMDFPGSDLHLLFPQKDKIWAVKVSGAWRITFKFKDGDAFIVDYTNYH